MTLPMLSFRSAAVRRCERGRFEMTKSADVLDLLVESGPLTTEAIMDILEREEWQVHQALRILRKKKLAYISNWLPHSPTVSGRPTPTYSAGDKPNVKVKAKTRNEIAADYRARNRALIRAKVLAKEGRTFSIWSGLS